jgi:hypothetical protein
MAAQKQILSFPNRNAALHRRSATLLTRPLLLTIHLPGRWRKSPLAIFTPSRAGIFQK